MLSSQYGKIGILLLSLISLGYLSFRFRLESSDIFDYIKLYSNSEENKV